MELKAQTAKLWQRFESQGTLGPGAQRKDLGMLEGMQAVAYAMVGDSLYRFDNSEIDRDPRPGFTSYTKADLEAKMSSEQPAGSGPVAELDPGKLETMVQLGVFTKEEADQLLQEVNHLEAKNNCLSTGEVSKSPDGTIFTVQVTTGDENDIEYLLSGKDGVRSLHVQPSATGFTAVAFSYQNGEGYKETLSGDWNLIQS